MLSDIWYIGRRLTCQVKIKPMLLKSSLLLRHQMLGKGRHVAQVKISPFSHRSGDPRVRDLMLPVGSVLKNLRPSHHHHHQAHDVVRVQPKLENAYVTNTDTLVV